MDDLNTTSEIIDVDEARRRLEAVRPIVEGIMGVSREIGSLQQELRSGRSDPGRQGVLEDRHDTAQATFREKLRELNEHGAVLKDPMTGLIDFYTWIEGDLAFLCWHHGEESINYWHGLKEGYSGRKPVPPTLS